MLTITTTKYIEPFKSQIISVRNTVFCQEQGVHPSLEIDGLDESCIHSLVFSNKIPIATGRMQNDGHIGRIAVLKSHRKQGVGSKIILSLIEHANSLGLDRVYLASQVDAVPFYKKLGFTEMGSIYVEANIDHINMKRMI